MADLDIEAGRRGSVLPQQEAAICGDELLLPRVDASWLVAEGYVHSRNVSVVKRWKTRLHPVE